MVEMMRDEGADVFDLSWPERWRYVFRFGFHGF